MFTLKLRSYVQEEPTPEEMDVNEDIETEEMEVDEVTETEETIGEGDAGANVMEGEATEDDCEGQKEVRNILPANTTTTDHC